MSATSIEWTERTWNPLRGCTEVSPGCTNCYAAAVAYRFSGPGQPYEGLAYKDGKGKIHWTGKVREVPEKLAEPLSWRKPSMVFVNSMSDLFHRDVPEDYIIAVGRVMVRARWHTYQVLTKRSERMRDMLSGPLGFASRESHIWWGVSVEDRAYGLPRLGHLRDAPAGLRMLSVEPLLEDLGVLSLEGIDWLIVGGESGPGARACRPEWVRSIVGQCQAVNVPVFVKQLGGNVVTRNDEVEDQFNNLETGWPDPEVEHDIHGFREEYQGADCRIWLRHKKGGDPAEWPADLRVREMPQPKGVVA